MFRSVVIGLVVGAFARGAARESSLRVDPHAYGGPRGNEPRTQLVAGTVQSWRETKTRSPWEISLHLEGETAGRRDISFDLDRAWIFTPLAHDADWGVAWGRVHPWDIARHPEAQRPWGLLGRQSPQNQGVLLGYGLSPHSLEPSPILLGWLGAHFWSDIDNDDTFAWGVSVTPFFLPTMGPELTLSATDPATTGRFGRRPPGFVEVNGQTLPLRYELDRARIFEDIVLQPQLAAQARIRETKDLETWLWISRAPSPEPTFDTQEFLRVREDSVQAFAMVKPRFEQRWTSAVTQRWTFLDTQALVATAHVGTDKYGGGELGWQTPYTYFALAHELPLGTIEARAGEKEGRYLDWLAQADALAPLGNFTLHTGAKRHLKQTDLWWRSGVRYALSREADLDLATDLFAGPDRSYFGEWRTNDRVSLVLRWEVGL